MNKLTLYFALIIALAACNAADTTKVPEAAIDKPNTDIPAINKEQKDSTIKPAEPSMTASSDADITPKTFQKEDGSWGYQIFMNGNLYINQYTIPGVSGTRGFVNEAKASVAGNFVIAKIKTKAGKPTVSVKELDSLGVLK